MHRLPCLVALADKFNGDRLVVHPQLRLVARAPNDDGRRRVGLVLGDALDLVRRGDLRRHLAPGEQLTTADDALLATKPVAALGEALEAVSSRRHARVCLHHDGHGRCAADRNGNVIRVDGERDFG